MGLDRNQKTPCGFCFVEYYTNESALDCMKYINFSRLDNRIIRTDLDPGFKDGRQYGRGKSGGQVRDEYRSEFDKDRGGWGRFQEEVMKQRKIQTEKYGDGEHSVPSGEIPINSRLGGPVEDSRAKRRGYESDEEEPTSKKRRND
ncbi:hypothetical protein BB560_005876 [Smittium megazygosporum]|uniref:Nuclear cap-binding protein subunit 2 n=1 Tax=Smittium megazygosporum TaxID=133381 RepID=A0A2T9YSA9_9FUNG|nr:hypothetical protein BB560_005896 [Smittium megazygosporum]PVU95209.1 hypothetical protein BB560_005876 [Smittium megazygosporum]